MSRGQTFISAYNMTPILLSSLNHFFSAREIGSVFNVAMDAVENVTNDIGNAVGGVIDDVGNAVEGVVNDVGNGVGNVAKLVNRLFTATRVSTYASYSDVFDAIGSIF